MPERLTLRLLEPVQAHKAMATAWLHCKAMLTAGHVLVLEVRTEDRTAAQNRLQWPILTAFSKQLLWPVNGRMERLAPDEWKDLLTAAFRGESVRLAMGLSGGVVMLGTRTSKFSKAQFSEWIEFLYATAADREVVLPAWEGDQ